MPAKWHQFELLLSRRSGIVAGLPIACLPGSTQFLILTMMNNQAQSSTFKHQHAPVPGMSMRSRQDQRARGRQEPLTDEQFVASSLALVAHLSQRVRGQSHRQS